MNIGNDFGGSLAVLVVLLIFGVSYNAWVAHLEQSGRGEGFTSLLVVAGVLVTLGGLWLLTDTHALQMALLVFVATGTPMILGSLWRYAKQREEFRNFFRGQ